MASRRLSVLWLTPFVPYPPEHGGAVRIFHLLRCLSKSCTITLCSLTSAPPNEDSRRALEAFCSAVHIIQRPTQTKYFPPRLAPPAVFQDDVPEMRTLVGRLQAEHPADILQIDYPSLSTYLDFRGPSVTCLTELDVTYLTVYRRFLVERSWLRKLRRLLGSLTFFYYEMRQLPRYATVIAMSEYDRRTFQRWLPHLPLTVIPNGVNGEDFALAAPPLSPALLFVGNFSHPPNTDAMVYFLQRIWPEVSARFATLRLMIVGEVPPEIRALASDRVELVGQVPHPPRDCYRRATITIVPIRFGSGTRLKVLEAFAAYVPVVSTTLGAEGLDVTPEEHLLLADTPEAFVSQITRLLTDAALYRHLQLNARRLIEQRYDWPILAQQQLELYQRLLRQTAP